MKMFVREQYGPTENVKVKDINKPTPKPNEVLIKIEAASVNCYDWRLLTADPFLVRLACGLLKPRNPLLGADVAGRVEAVGSSAKLFRPGDEVYGDISACGNGGFAEYVCAREDTLTLKPANLTFEQAAAVPMAAITALQGMRDVGHIRAGQKVLIHGAAGGVGTFAVQIAKAFGAEVTAVCSTRNVAMARSLGADYVIDYTKEDFAQSGKRYDLILAVNGRRSIWDYRRALCPNGIYVMAGGSNLQLFQALLLGPWLSMNSSQKMTHVAAKPDAKDLAFVSELLETGKVVPVIDRRYPLHKVPEAIQYVGTGHARGKVVISMEQRHAAA